MRTYRSRSGPFTEMPFFKPGVIDRICADELQKVSLYPGKPEPVRIERFIEKRFSVSPTYESTPAGVLGFTRFGSRGVESIVISASLIEDQSAVSQRRANSTLAHEAGHGLLHAHLFALAAADDVTPLFGGELETGVPRILCRDQDAASDANRRRYDGRWWETQANQAIGGLLLPRALVKECVASLSQANGAFGEVTLATSTREQACRLVAETFDVNPIAARIRLDQIFPASLEGQLTF